MPDHVAPRAAIIGGGPAGLMAATVLAEAGVKVTLYERMPTVGRKFLLAGRGGLNLTHSEMLPEFLLRYRGARPVLAPMIEAFSPADLIRFAEALGEETFVGSSGRVFPKSFKASPLLRAWLRRLNELGVEIRTRHEWVGFDRKRIVIRDAAGITTTIDCDLVVMALGGASWPRLGSNGVWRPLLESTGAIVNALRPANCGFVVGWSEHVRRFAGEPLKRIALHFAGETARGDAMVTQNGLEGGAVYALSAPLRDAIARDGQAMISVDFRPDIALEALATKLAKRGAGHSVTTWLRKAAGLSPVSIAVIRDAAENALPADPERLARLIKAAPIRLKATQPIDRAISSAGGVTFESLDDRLMLRTMPGVFVAGEMLDWEAPTGGYLLQACFATGAAAARGALSWRSQNG